MTEEQLNKEWLIKELKGFSYSNELLDKILELLSNQYINGLEQSRFDKRMLEHENRELLKEKQEWIKLLDMFKNQQKEFIKQLEKLAHQDMVYSDFANGCKVAYGIALNKYKEIVGVNGD